MTDTATAVARARSPRPSASRADTPTPQGSCTWVHRYYDPGTGQFLSVDSDLSSTHRPYAYANDNPTNSSDPSGLCSPLPTPQDAYCIEFDAFYQALAGRSGAELTSADGVTLLRANGWSEADANAVIENLNPSTLMAKVQQTPLYKYVAAARPNGLRPYWTPTFNAAYLSNPGMIQQQLDLPAAPQYAWKASSIISPYAIPGADLVVSGTTKSGGAETIILNYWAFSYAWIGTVGLAPASLTSYQPGC